MKESRSSQERSSYRAHLLALRSRMFSSRHAELTPVFDRQPLDAPEFPLIISDNRRAVGQSVCGDEQVHGTDDPAGSLQIRTDFAVRVGRRTVERSYLQRRAELPQSNAVLIGLGASFHAVFEFGECNRGDADFANVASSEPFEDLLASPPNQLDANTGIEHIANHSAVRSSAARP